MRTHYGEAKRARVMEKTRTHFGEAKHTRIMENHKKWFYYMAREMTKKNSFHHQDLGPIVIF